MTERAAFDGFVSIGGEKRTLMTKSQMSRITGGTASTVRAIGSWMTSVIRIVRNPPCDRGTQADIAVQLERLAAVIPVADLE